MGRYLRAHLQAQHYQVKAYGRGAFASIDDLVQAIDGSGLLIILVGENIGKRWSDTYKQALIDSRIKTTQMIAEALERCESPPAKILCASAIGLYPQNKCDQPVDESCLETGKGFLGQLGDAWEQASMKLLPTPIIMRFGVVLGKDGGALQKMLPAFQLGLGGPVAGGQQCFSWVHINDLTRAIQFLVESEQANGAYNICAPNPVTNKAFGSTLAHVLHRPFWLPLPAFQLKLMFGEGAQVLTHSSCVLPTRLTEAGFEFTYSDVKEALVQLLKSRS